MEANQEIVKLIEERLALGRERYGHGIILDDDTTQYGTEKSSWTLMALEEVLDMAIYTAARILQIIKASSTPSSSS
jgi:hypothetical protein